jgi:hypothetical protein
MQLANCRRIRELKSCRFAVPKACNKGWIGSGVRRNSCSTRWSALGASCNSYTLTTTQQLQTTGRNSMACSRLSLSVCVSTNSMRWFKKHFQAWARRTAGNVKIGAPEEFWGSYRRDCNPNKQNANDHNNNNKNLQLPLQWLYESLRLIVPPSHFHSKTLLQSKLQLELKNSTMEPKHTHTHTHTLSLSL